MPESIPSIGPFEPPTPALKADTGVSSRSPSSSLKDAEGPAVAKQQPAAARAMAKKESKQSSEASTTPNELWIVRCDVSPEAIDKGGIVRSNPPKSANRPQRAFGEAYDALTKNVALFDLTKQGVDARESTQGQQFAPARKASAPHRTVYVKAEATSSQVAAVLDNLKTKPQMVAAISGAVVDASPSANSEALAKSGSIVANAVPRQSQIATTMSTANSAGRWYRMEQPQRSSRPARRWVVDRATDSRTNRRVSTRNMVPESSRCRRSRATRRRHKQAR